MPSTAAGTEYPATATGYSAIQHHSGTCGWQDKHAEMTMNVVEFFEFIKCANLLDSYAITV